MMSRRLVAALLAAFVFTVAPAGVTTTIDWTVLTQNGLPASGGTVTATLSYIGTSIETGLGTPATMRTSVAIGSDGHAVIALTPNDLITPANTHYVFEFNVTGPDAGRWFERRIVPQSGSAIRLTDTTILSSGQNLGPPLTRVFDEGVPIADCSGLNLIGPNVTASYGVLSGTCDVTVSSTTGSGTTNQIPLWTDGPGGILGDSPIAVDPSLGDVNVGPISGASFNVTAGSATGSGTGGAVFMTGGAGGGAGGAGGSVTLYAGNAVGGNGNGGSFKFRAGAKSGSGTSNGSFQFCPKGGTNCGTLGFDNLTAARSFTFPDSSGIVAETSNIPAAANPTATISGSANNGAALTYMRSDAAPALATSGVTAGSCTYCSVTVDAYGRLTAQSSGTPVSDAAYDATSWDGVTGTAPSKNAVRDKFESLAFSNLSGSATCAQLPALTGDATSSAGSCATTIANAAVTYAKMQNISAQGYLLGRSSSGAGSPQEIACDAAVCQNLLAQSTTASERSALGLAIGTDVQAWDADLDDLADGSLTGSKVGAGVLPANVSGGGAFPTGTIGVPFYSQVSGSNFTTSSTTLVDVTGLTASVVSGATYEVEAFVTFNSADTNGVKFGINDTGSVSTVETSFAGPASTTNYRGLRVSALNTATSAAYGIVSGGIDAGLLVKGLLVTTASGTVSIQILKVTSGTATVYVGSYLKLTRVS